MKQLIFWILFWALCFTAGFVNPANAEDEMGPRLRLPEVPTVTFDEGMPDKPIANGQYKVVSVEQWKAILMVAVAYQGLYDWRLQTQGALKAYKEMEYHYDSMLENLNLQISTLSEHNEYLTLRLNQAQKTQHKITLSARMEKIALYSVIVMETALLVYAGVRGIHQ